MNNIIDKDNEMNVQHMVISELVTQDNIIKGSIMTRGATHITFNIMKNKIHEEILGQTIINLFYVRVIVNTNTISSLLPL